MEYVQAAWRVLTAHKDAISNIISFAAFLASLIAVFVSLCTAKRARRGERLMYINSQITDARRAIELAASHFRETSSRGAERDLPNACIEVELKAEHFLNTLDNACYSFYHDHVDRKEFKKTFYTALKQIGNSKYYGEKIHSSADKWYSLVQFLEKETSAS